jgi:FkbM family methyltransferase
MTTTHMSKFVNMAIRTIEKLTGYEILVHKRNANKSKSSTRYLAETTRYINQISCFIPKNVFEIGANYGQDADFLKREFNLSNKNVYVFEPHPELFKMIKERYGFNCNNYAVSNRNGKCIFHTMNLNKNNGASSLMVHKYNDKKMYSDITVQTRRMDYFISKNNIKSIDFLKIDVEGLTYEVLSGFGKSIQMVKAVQVETEFLPIWKGQKTWSDVYKLLSIKGFQLIDYRLHEGGTQADSFWIQKRYVDNKIFNLKNNRWEDMHK